MSFRPRQPLHRPGGADVVFDVLEADERNVFSRKLVNQSQVALPDVESTDLTALLAAGIDPKRVNPTIIHGRNITTDLSDSPSSSDDDSQTSNNQGE